MVKVAYTINKHVYHGELKINKLFLGLQYSLSYDTSITIVPETDGYPMYYGHVVPSQMLYNKNVPSVLVILETPTIPGNMSKFLYVAIREATEFISIYY